MAISSISAPQTKPSKHKDKKSFSERNAIITKANHLLASNPKDTKALTSLADLYFNEEDFGKAMRTYHLILEQGVSDSKEKTKLNLHYGISAMRIEQWEEAYEGLMIAKNHIIDHPEMNFSLGKIEFMRENYKKALKYIRRVVITDPDYPEIQKYMGLVLFNLNSFMDAKEHLEKALSLDPADVNSTYALGRCMQKTKNWNQALDLLKGLCSDPDLGPQACLNCGIIATNLNFPKQAIVYFERGLRLKNIPDETLLRMKYLLAVQYAEQVDAEKGFQLFCEVNDLSPGYKDTLKRIKKYGELTLNKNLDLYIRAPFRVFKKICIKIIPLHYASRNVGIKILNTLNNKSECLDIVVNVKSKNRENMVLFRFMRIDGRIGELCIREFYTDMKEGSTSRGVFVAPGDYTAEAIAFVEARFIELVDKKKMIKLLNRFHI